MHKGIEEVIQSGIKLENLGQAEAIIVCMSGMANRPENEVMINSALNAIIAQQWPSVQVNRSICGLIKTFATHLKQE